MVFPCVRAFSIEGACSLFPPNMSVVRPWTLYVQAFENSFIFEALLLSSLNSLEKISGYSQAAPIRVRQGSRERERERERGGRYRGEKCAKASSVRSVPSKQRKGGL